MSENRTIEELLKRVRALEERQATRTENAALEQGAPEPRLKGTRGHGRVYLRKYADRSIWWLEFWSDGKQHRESAGTQSREVALRLLGKKLGEVADGLFMPRSARRFGFDDLAAMLTSDYVARGRRSLDRAERAVAHLRRFFGSDRATDITSDRSDAFIATRRTEGAAPATIQREIALLGRMFTLALKAGKVARRPRFTRPEVENTRVESFTDPELDRLLDVLANGRHKSEEGPEAKPQPNLVPPIVFAAWTGWRMKSDVLPLRWEQVDFSAGTVTRWSRGTSKAGEHIVFPFKAVPDLTALLERQRQERWRLERERGEVMEFVFTRQGERIRDFRAAWDSACRRAGVPGRVPHDLRRTAARKLRVLGMGDRDIAELCGWRTVAMVSRYLGRDPAGVAERLSAKLAGVVASRTFHARSGCEAEKR